MSGLDISEKFYQRASRLAADLAQMKSRTLAPAPVSGSQSSLDIAITRAVHFLEKEFHVAGCWNDFFYVAWGGRDWITAYVGWSLLQANIANHDIVHQASTLLERDRYPSGGWGYRPGVPTDCDSTSWGILFLRAGEHTIDLSESVRVVLSHQDPGDGGFWTYSPDSKASVRQYMRVDSSEDLSGWCSSHLDVTCVAVQALWAVGLPADSGPIRNALAFIRDQQSAAGYWNSYWYYGKTYGVAHAIRVLRDVGSPSDKLGIARAREWLESTQLNDGSWDSGITCQSGRVFDTALAIRALLDVAQPPLSRVQRGIDWLLQLQNLDGSWEPKPILILPQGSDHTPWNRTSWPERGEERLHGICVADKNRFHTTATVLQALAAWSKYLLEAGKVETCHSLGPPAAS